MAGEPPRPIGARNPDPVHGTEARRKQVGYARGGREVRTVRPDEIRGPPEVARVGRGSKPEDGHDARSPSLNSAARMAASMCRMMGVVSQGPVYYDLFEEFADLATQGMCPIGAPDERGHKDGWGLACFQDGALKVYMRDAGPAAGASKYYGSAWKIAKLNAERAAGHSLIVMGHLRRASSQSLVAQKFAHPFIEERNGATWAFQHNGSLILDTGAPEKIDSQVLFDVLLDEL